MKYADGDGKVVRRGGKEQHCTVAVLFSDVVVMRRTVRVKRIAVALGYLQVRLCKGIVE